MSATLRVLLAVALGNALVPFNTTMLVIALPEIARDTGSDLAGTSWLITTYLIALTALQPIGGRLGDRYGRQRSMLFGFAYLGLASVGAALSTDLVVLAFFRLQQAIAGALIVPNGLGILRRAGGRRAGTHFGVITTVAGVGATLGPLVGASLTGIDWHLLFVVNVPVAAAAFWLATVRLPEAAEVRERKPGFDLVGAVSLGLVLFGLAWALTSLGRGVSDAGVIALGIAAVVGLVAFVRYESSIADPMLPPAMFRSRAFTAANLAILFANVALYVCLVAVPALFVDTPGAAVIVGFALTALNVPGILLGPATGLVVDRWGARWPATFGGVLIAAGAVAAGLTLAAGRNELLWVAMLVLGAGVPLTFPATRIAAVDAVPERDASLASGVLATSRSFGGMLGVTMVAVAVTAVSAPARGPGIFAVVALSGVLVAAASLGMPNAPSVPSVATAEPV